MISVPSPLELSGSRRDVGVVLLHSYTGSARDMKFVGPALNAAGYSVFAPILRGHRERTYYGPLLGGNPDDWWQDVQAAVCRMHRQTAQVAVFGLSLGGVLAMRAICELPEVCGGGVMAAPIVDGSPVFADTVAGYFDYVQRFTGVTIDRPALAPAVARQNAAIRHLAHGVLAEMPACTKPVFIAQGGADTVIDPETAHRTQAVLTHAPVSAHWYPDAGHILTADPVWPQLTQDLLTFLQTFAPAN